MIGELALIAPAKLVLLSLQRQGDRDDPVPMRDVALAVSDDVTSEAKVGRIAQVRPVVAAATDATVATARSYLALIATSALGHSSA